MALFAATFFNLQQLFYLQQHFLTCIKFYFILQQLFFIFSKFFFFNYSKLLFSATFLNLQQVFVCSNISISSKFSHLLAGPFLVAATQVFFLQLMLEVFFLLHLLNCRMEVKRIIEESYIICTHIFVLVTLISCFSIFFSQQLIIYNFYHKLFFISAMISILM